MTFTVTLTTDNAAFDGRETTETARILIKVANRILDGELSGKCQDKNGNAVGAFGFDKRKGRK